MRYTVSLLVFSLLLAFAMKGYGWSLNFSLFVIPLAYAFFALYLNVKQHCTAIRSFLVVLGILIIFNIANYIGYLINSGGNYYDHESRLFSLYILGVQVGVYVASQLLLIGIVALIKKQQSSR